MKKLLHLSCVAWSLLAGFAIAAEEAPVDPKQAKLEQEFTEQMKGVYLKGFFTLLGREQAGLKEEKYTISSVEKLKGTKWLFNVRIQYGKNDATLPLALDVIWSGDTPVITLTDMLIPGFGKFTSRVMIYRGQYAGTWDGGLEADGKTLHGGHLFGVIEKIEAEKK
jgi:hypothetical protein